MTGNERGVNGNEADIPRKDRKMKGGIERKGRGHDEEIIGNYGT